MKLKEPPVTGSNGARVGVGVGGGGGTGVGVGGTGVKVGVGGRGVKVGVNPAKTSGLLMGVRASANKIIIPIKMQIIMAIVLASQFLL